MQTFRNLSGETRVYLPWALTMSPVKAKKETDMFKTLITGAIALSLLVGPAAQAHEKDLITAKGLVGPIRVNETTTSEMREMFGPPKARKIVRIGCSRVVKLRWEDIQTFSYRGQGIVVDVKVLSRVVEALDESYAIHTLKGLQVGDSERRLKRLYDPNPTEPHRGHTHYLLNGDKPKLLAKVVDGMVVQLEAAPYEYC